MSATINDPQVTSTMDTLTLDRELAQMRLPKALDVADLLKALPTSECLAQANAVFCDYPKTALIGATSRSLLYILTRYLKPNHVLEIGTYKAGTSEILTHALSCNGHGTLITIDPFGQERVPPILKSWPESLKKHIVYMPVSSMDCFIHIEQRNILFDFLFVDGDHSYEYALFDLQMAARSSKPGAIIVMDNVEQTGVYWAVKTFLSLCPDWRELGSSINEYDLADPYNTMRPSFPDSSFLILQGPRQSVITDRPRSFNTSYAPQRGLAGFDLDFKGHQENGTMNALIFFRSFWHGGYSGEAEQKMKMMSFPIAKGETCRRITFDEPFITEHLPENSYRTFEIVLSWLPSDTSMPIELINSPTPLTIT